MDNSKIKIKSKQIYNDHVDSIEEEYEYYMEKTEIGIKITYGKTILMIQKDAAIIDNENVRLVVENNKRNMAKYKTPYGEINMETEGLKIEILDGPILARIKYIIKIGNSTEYVNELQIEYSW